MPPPSATTRKAKPVKAQGRRSTRKATPKKPVSQAETVRRLFSSLCSQIDGAHFANAIKTCDKILRIYPDDVDALSTKLFLLLQIDQYQSALTVINGSKDRSKLAFENAYALYRSHENVNAHEATKSLKEKNPEDRGLAHLEAQLFYRDGMYQEAHDLYTELLDSADPATEEHSDILTNLQAAQKHLDFINNDYLHAIETLPTSIRNTLETAPPPMPSSSLLTAAPSTQQQSLTTPADKPKKVRMSRVPAGVTPGVTPPPPDPERWLKKSERSTYNQGRRRRGGGGATQGSAAFDVSASVSASGVKSGGGKGKRKK